MTDKFLEEACKLYRFMAVTEVDLKNKTQQLIESHSLVISYNFGSWAFVGFVQGTLSEGDGSVQLTSLYYKDLISYFQNASIIFFFLKIPKMYFLLQWQTVACTINM
jgi:hypothetical protein